jgi:hypothetical protein
MFIIMDLIFSISDPMKDENYYIIYIIIIIYQKTAGDNKNSTEAY